MAADGSIGTTADAEAVVRAFGEAWTGHDLPGALAMLTPDCVFEATGPAPDGVRHVGPDSIAAAWRPIFDDTASRFETELSFCAGDRVVQLWRYSWADGHVRGIDVFRVADGRIAEKLSYVKG